VGQAVWRGQILLKLQYETQQNTNKQTNKQKLMKTKIENATSAFGVLLTSLVQIALEITASKATEEAPSKVKPQATETAKAAKAGKAAEIEAEAEELLYDEKDEEVDNTVTIEQLRAAGQAAIKVGKADKMKAILKKAGADNLRTLDTENYETVLASLKKLV
jgi:hypothetical protein